MYISCKVNPKTFEVIYIQTELFFLSFPSLAMSRSFPPKLLPSFVTFAANLSFGSPWFPSLSSATTLGHEPGTVLSCGEKAPRCGIKPCVPVGTTYLTTNLPCLDLGPLGWLVWGKGGASSLLKKHD